MEVVRNQYLEGELVRLDGKHFIDCTLCNCTLEYAGGRVVLERTHITGCDHVFCGPAKCTVSYLELMGLVAPASIDSPSASPHVH